MKIVSVAEMIAAEKAADEAGHSYETMMELAGHGVAAAIMSRYEVTGKRFVVLVGPGNNGGDGLVAGRYLAEAGAKVMFYLFKERDPEQDNNFRKVQEMGLDAVVAQLDQRQRVLRLRLNGCDFVVDALLGTGVTRPIGGELAQVLRQVAAGLTERAQLMTEEHKRQLGTADWPPLTRLYPISAPAQKPPRPKVIAVDCPSGLNCDSGQLDPLALAADMTVTFGGPKRGHFVFPGAAAVGEVSVVDIGIGPQIDAVQTQSFELVTAARVAELLPQRPSDGHKGTFGRNLIAAGSSQYRGAAILSATAAFRTGAGLVALATPTVVRHAAVTLLPEATYPVLEVSEHLDDTSAQYLLETLARYDAVLLGPGLGDAETFVLKFLAGLPDDSPPIVIDADGLNLLAQREDWPHVMRPNMVLTPHPGEMARLCDLPLAEIREADRVELGRKQAAEWGCTVLLKGAYTVIAAPDGRCALLPFANPVLGTAGSGDVLAGVITALLGQGCRPYEAAVAGGYLHGMAGELMRQSMGDAGALASEIGDQIPAARHLLQW